jgi:hypothetical protein
MPAEAYLVFSQRPETSVDLAGWGAHAQRFFGAAVTASAEGDRLAVTPRGEVAALRFVRGRPATAADHALATRAEAHVGGGGLGSLAQRCPTVWEVVREAEQDPAALRVAALLAGVLLGPVVDPGVPEIFGVKTAREKLERLAASR